MFSLAISSICDCWRWRSPSIAAAISGSAAASAAEKNPSSRSATAGRSEEIARTTPIAARDSAHRRGIAVIYHISIADVSRLPAIASATGNQDGWHEPRRGRAKSCNENHKDWSRTAPAP
jgi:hypothetical protein